VATHDVTNQVPDFAGHDLFTTDATLTESFARWGSSADRADLEDLGTAANSVATQRLADQADNNPPMLRTHDRRGLRIDEVDFHPAYHSLMTTAIGHGLTAEPWTRPAASGQHLRRAAGFVVWSQAEAGHLCPISMSYAAAPALRSTPDLADRWVPLLASRTYDPELGPLATKTGVTMGMGMTEKQGGSDVRANTTRAVADGDGWRLTGHKWFCSAPMSDAFLVLAQTDAGVGCFLVPRVLDDGSRNVFALQRLKDKLGNRSNASSEVEFDHTFAWLVGDDGRGVRTIIDMVASTRLDCVLGSSATIRQALVRALWHARHRSAFGARLVDQPLMRNVLVDLALESEAATLLAMRLAHAVDAGDSDLSRLGVAVGKFWVCKRTAPMVAEALECLGGVGYVEENGLARLYREAPLNSIWEGSGNVNALDVLRAISREPASLAAVAKDASLARGHSRVLDRAIDEIEPLAGLVTRDAAAWNARRIVERLALTLQAALLVQHSPAVVADAFIDSRLDGDHGVVFGTLGASRAACADAILDRALPV
jgi:putative acyl-CoA dehydrogenase